MHFADFVTCAMDEVVNQIAKSRYMFGGQLDCPLTLRMPYGIGRSGGGHHSNSVEAWFVNTPGLKVCIPSTPADARGLLKTAIRDPDPVLVFEHRGLYRVTGEVPEAETLVPLGVADVKRPGRDATVIATARMVHASLEAARRLAEEGIARGHKAVSAEIEASFAAPGRDIRAMSRIFREVDGSLQHGNLRKFLASEEGKPKFDFADENLRQALWDSFKLDAAQNWKEMGCKQRSRKGLNQHHPLEGSPCS